MNSMLDAPKNWLISRDPLGFAAGDQNLYRFVGDDPVNFVDPSGLEKGFVGNLDAIWKSLRAIGFFDVQAGRRFTGEWANEARQFAKEMADKYKHCPGIDAERLENAARHAYWQ